MTVSPHISSLSGTLLPTCGLVESGRAEEQSRRQLANGIRQLHTVKRVLGGTAAYEVRAGRCVMWTAVTKMHARGSAWRFRCVAAVNTCIGSIPLVSWTEDIGSSGKLLIA